MDLLKQLESKMQTLVQQRNQLKDELDALKAAGATGDREIQSLKARLEEVMAEKRYMMAMPAKIMVSGVMPLYFARP